MPSTRSRHSRGRSRAPDAIFRDGVQVYDGSSRQGNPLQTSYVDLNAFSLGSSSVNLYLWNTRANLSLIQNICERDSYASGLLRNIVGFSVGKGLQVDFGVDRLNKEFSGWRWSATSPTAKMKDLQEFAVRQLVRDGDILLEKDESAGKSPGLKLYPVECRYVYGNGANLQGGVEVDNALRPVAYLYSPTSHPIGDINPLTSRRILADDVIHVFKIEHSNQVRGLSWLRTAVNPLQSLREFDNLVILGADKAVNNQGFLTFPSEWFTEARQEEEADDEVAAVRAMMERNVKIPRTGTKIYPQQASWVSTHSAGITDTEMIYQIYTFLMRRVVKAVGLSVYALTSDYGKTGVVNARQAYIADIKFYEEVQDYLHTFMCEVVDWWIDYWMDIRPDWFVGYKSYEISTPPFPFSDPLREANALERLNRIGAITPQQIIKGRGGSVQQTMQELREWAEMLAEIEKDTGVNPLNPTKMLAQPDVNPEADEPDRPDTGISNG